MVRVFVRVPGGGRVAILVDPSARVGPKTKHRPNRFEEVWGEDAEAMGPCSFGVPRPLTPMKEAMFLQDQRRLQQLAFEDTGPSDLVSIDGQPMPSPMAPGALISSVPVAARPGGRRQQPTTLKDAVAIATGVPPEQQKLVLRGRGPLDDDDCHLTYFDFRDGTECVLSVKLGAAVSRPGARGQRFLSSPALAHDRQPIHVRNVLSRAQALADEARPAARTPRSGARARSKGSPPVFVKPVPDWFRADQGYTCPKVAASDWEV